MAITVKDLETIATHHNLTIERSNAGHARLFGTPEACIASQVDFQRLRLFPNAHMAKTIDGVPDEGFRPHVFVHCQAIVKE